MQSKPFLESRAVLISPVWDNQVVILSYLILSYFKLWKIVEARADHEQQGVATKEGPIS